MAGEDSGRQRASRRRLGFGAAVVLVLAAFAVSVAIGLLRTAGTPAQLVPTTEATGFEVAEGTPSVYVHVSGAVAAPGLYALRAGARVVDAIAAAEGFAPDADRQGVNLARPVSDGEQLRVPREGEDPQPGADGAGADGRVDLNTADASVLDTLPRIGPALADRIIRWREANGRFTSVDDLLAVPGFGDTIVDGLRDLVTV